MLLCTKSHCLQCWMYSRPEAALKAERQRGRVQPSQMCESQMCSALWVLPPRGQAS